MIAIECEFCGIEFETYPSRLKDYSYKKIEHHFCSNSCRSKFYAKERQRRIGQICQWTLGG